METVILFAGGFIVALLVSALMLMKQDKSKKALEEKK